jgi:hypothetical protein
MEMTLEALVVAGGRGVGAGPRISSGMADLTGIKLAHARRLGEAENARFVAERPKSMALGERARRSMPRGVPVAWMDDLYDHPPVWVSHGDGSRFTDVDGHTYLDMYVADMSTDLFAEFLAAVT